MSAVRAAGPAWAALLLCVAAAGCGDDAATTPAESADTIPREIFVATYVDLRLTALRGSGRAITPEAREEVLSSHGVTQEDLLRFVEVHGERVRYMQGVWEEVEDRINAHRSGSDTASS